MQGALGDLKHALRIYRRTPVASGVAVVALAIAMAFVTAFLSMYVDVALRPHPGFEQSGRLVTVGQTNGRQLNGLPVGLVNRMAEEVSSVEAVAGLYSSNLRLADVEEPVTFEFVTRNFFAGLRPLLWSGRGFEPAEHEPDAAKVTVISYRYWRDALEGADVLDTVVTLEFEPLFRPANTATAEEAEEEDYEFRIVGIMAPEMTGTLTTTAAIWLPFERTVGMLVPGNQNLEQLRNTATLQSLARRPAGVSADSVISEIDARYSESTDEFRLQSGYRVDAIAGVVRNLTEHRETKRQLRLFLTVSVLLALVAAANVSLFLLARAPGRRRELGIRTAVGAPLGRLARQLASESGLLVVVAALIGLGFSIWIGGFLRGLAFLQQASWRDVSLLDWRVLSLVGTFLLIQTVLVSLAPIVGLKRLGIAASSRQVAARASFAQRFAAALQIAIAGALGGAALAFGWYLFSLTLVYPGYEHRDRFVVQYTTNNAGLTAERQRELMAATVVDLSRRRETIEAIPGVSAVAFGTPVPGLNSRSTWSVPDPSDATRQIQIRMGTVDSRFVDVLGLRLLHGRSFADGDTNVVMVNRAFARRFFRRDDVVGEALGIGTGTMPGLEIVGVLDDLSFEHPSADVEPIVFQMMTRSATGTAVIESSLTAAGLQQELNGLSQSGGLEVRVGQLRPMTQLRDTLIAADRARSWLTIGAASLVVVLAAVGFYGTQRFLVTAGRREYAIRASIGAGPKALGRLVIRRGLLLGLPGLVVGTLLAFVAVAWLRDGFVSRDISPFAITLVVVAGLMLLVSAASLGPARQARRTQPAPLLREE